MKSLSNSFLSESLLLDLARKSVYLAIRRDGAIGDGTRANPYNCAPDGELDRILLLVENKENTRFVFGPGVYRTQGGPRNHATGFGFVVLRGQQFVGAGRDQTILRLILPSSEVKDNAGYLIFASLPNINPPTDDVLIQDMTLDCAMERQPNSPSYDYPRIRTEAIGLAGRNIRLKGLRIINFGTRAPYYTYGSNNVGLECFPVAGGNPPQRCRKGGKFSISN